MTDQEKILEEARAVETSTELKSIPLTPEEEMNGMHEPVSQRRPQRSTIKQMIVDNPGPALLIGAGLGWLFINREREKDQALHQRMMDHGTSLKENTQESVAELKSTTTENLQALSEKVGEKRNIIADRGRSAGQYMAENYRDMKENNPLVLGACALLGGLAIGMMLPPTLREDALMGDARNTLLDEAKRIVEDARDAAVSTLKSSKESIADSVQETGQEIADTAKEAFQDAKEQTKSNLNTSSNQDRPIM